MKRDNREPVDRLLEDALAAYSRQEPRPGLEQRVWNRVQAGGASRRWAFPRWRFALPIAACLMLAAIFWSRRIPQPDVRQVARKTVEFPVAAPPRPEVETPRRVVRARKGVRGKAFVAPRLPEFPIPAPITAEERALLILVARAPREAREAFLEGPRQAAEPIRIEEIKIQPLQGDGSQ